MNRHKRGIKQCTAILIAGLAVIELVVPTHAQVCNPLDRTKLLATDGGTGNAFGWSVAVSGNTAVVGAPADDDNGTGSGSAYVFRFDGLHWSEEAKLLPSDPATQDRFGFDVSISGDTIIVGAPAIGQSATGSAYVFRFNGAQWFEEQKLLPADAALLDYVGISVAISGDCVVIGADHDADNGIASGSAFVFRLDGSQWIEEAKLLASDGAPNDIFGNAVAVSGNIVLVGASKNNSDIGSAYVFRFDGAIWSEEAVLLASDFDFGDFFGGSVAVLGHTALVGAYRADSTDTGAAYVFGFDGFQWNEQVKLIAADGTVNGLFGLSVALSDDIAVIGTSSDAAHVFRVGDSLWTEQGKLYDGPGNGFGAQVAASNGTAIVGAPNDSGNAVNAGAAHVFDLDCVGSCSADFDGDGVSDTNDLSSFVGCMDGPESPIISGCESGDIDGDSDSDMADFALFQTSYGCVCTSPPCCPTITDVKANGTGESWLICDAVVSSTTDLVSNGTLKNFRMQDATGGITVFGTNAEINSILAEVAEGDQIDLQGTAGEFNGAFQLYAPFTVRGNDGFAGIPLATPTIVADYQNGSPTAESLESMLVQLDCVEFLQAGTFAGATSYQVSSDGGVTSATVRISTPNQDLVGQPIPTGPVTITGIFYQYDSTDPYNGDYQLLPRTLDDLDACLP